MMGLYSTVDVVKEIRRYFKPFWNNAGMFQKFRQIDVRTQQTCRWTKLPYTPISCMHSWMNMDVR